MKPRKLRLVFGSSKLLWQQYSRATRCMHARRRCSSPPASACSQIPAPQWCCFACRCAQPACPCVILENCGVVDSVVLRPPAASCVNPVNHSYNHLINTGLHKGSAKKNFTTGAKAAARASCQAQLQLQATAASTGWCVVQPAHAATLVMAHACCFLPSSTACRPCPDSCTLDSAALQAPPPPQQRVCRVQPASPAAL